MRLPRRFASRAIFFAGCTSVRLRAAQAIFSEMITVSKYSGLEARMTELEQQLEPVPAAGAGTNPWAPAAAGYGLGTHSAAVRPTSPGGAWAGSFTPSV